MRKRSREQATATERSEKRVILYHRTTRDKADSIKARGFIDATGTYFTDQEFSGVWVSDVPLDANEGACGDVLFEITLDVPEAAITDYEWVEEGKPYREWLMPAAVLNSHATLVEVSDAKVQTRDRFREGTTALLCSESLEGGRESAPEHEEVAGEQYDADRTAASRSTIN